MKNKKILIVVLFIIIIGLLIYNYKDKTNTQILITDSSNDGVCLGESDPYYSLGLGIKHYYTGKINQDKLVDVVLTCDHKKLKITGAVNQIISEDVEIADTTNGTEVIEIAQDYNFDGYNDLSSISINGYGFDARDTYFIYLYDPETNLFVFNKQLSDIENLYPDSVNKEIIQYFGVERGKEIVIRYRWVGKDLVQVK